MRIKTIKIYNQYNKSTEFVEVSDNEFVQHSIDKASQFFGLWQKEVEIYREKDAIFSLRELWEKYSGNLLLEHIEL